MPSIERFASIILVAVAAIAAVALGLNLSHPSGTSTTTQSGPNEYEFPTQNATSTIPARVGEVFLVQLISNAGSTGFDWRVTCSDGIHYINYTSVSTTTVMIGSDLRHYYFRAVTEGNQTITLENMRLFDPSQVAAVIDLTVVVK